VLRSVVKLGDGGREQGRSAGQASGSIISRVVRSYWNEGNAYRSVLQGVAIPGDDSAVSLKVARKIGSSPLKMNGDVWDIRLLQLISVEQLLRLMEG
jgi:hypothetical protein